MKEEKKIHCDSCHFFADKTEFLKSCGNCFACTGCEMYACPVCGYHIIIKAPGKKN